MSLSISSLRTLKEANLASPIIIDDNNLVFTRDDGLPLRLAYPNDKLKALD